MQTLSDEGQGVGALHGALARRETQALAHGYSHLGHQSLHLAPSYLGSHRLLLGQAHIGQFAGGYQ
jgi:hypothetical protein